MFIMTQLTIVKYDSYLYFLFAILYQHRLITNEKSFYNFLQCVLISIRTLKETIIFVFLALKAMRLINSQTIFIATVLLMTRKVPRIQSLIVIENNAYQDSDLILSLNLIIMHFNATKYSNVFVATSVNSSNKVKSMDILDSFLLNSISKLTLQFQQSRKVKRKINFVVNFVDNFVSFEKHFKTLSSVTLDYGGLYLVVLVNGLIPEVQQLFQMLWDIFIYNVSIIVHDGYSISLLSFKPFKEESVCGDMNPLEINTFVLKKWTTDQFFPNKLKKLYNCPVRVGAFEYEPACHRELQNDGHFKYTGSDMGLLYGIADALNFTLNITFMKKAGNWGVVFENGSGTGASEILLKGEVDMTVGIYFLIQVRAKYLSFTQVYLSSPSLVVIPPGAPLSALEKLKIPFKNIVWYYLLSVLLIGIFVITVVRRLPNVIQVLIFGSDIQSPLLNFINIIFGGSLHILPNTNFSRYLMMNFILFCLVQRTLYQGSLFKFLQSDLRGREIESLDEMVDNKFTFYMLSVSESERIDSRVLKM